MQNLKRKKRKQEEKNAVEILVQNYSNVTFHFKNSFLMEKYFLHPGMGRAFSLSLAWF